VVPDSFFGNPLQSTNQNKNWGGSFVPFLLPCRLHSLLKLLEPSLLGPLITIKLHAPFAHFVPTDMRLVSSWRRCFNSGRQLTHSLKESAYATQDLSHCQYEGILIFGTKRSRSPAWPQFSDRLIDIILTWRNCFDQVARSLGGLVMPVIPSGLCLPNLLPRVACAA
jgi:hypothetical protein